MSTETSDCQRILDLLPAYLNSTLEAKLVRLVREHLTACQNCQEELAAWEMIREATRLEAAALPLPSGALLEGVWARLDSPAPQTATRRQLALRWLLHGGHVLRAQTPLVRKGIWLTSAATIAVLLFGCTSAFLTPATNAAEVVFAFFAPLVAGASVLTIYQPEADPRLEMALSAPTSSRMVLLSRLALILGYDLAVSLAATALLTLIFGGNFLAAGALWFGPMLLVTGLSMLLSLVLGTLAALTGALSLELAHLLAQGSLESAWRVAAAPLNSLWQTNPLVIVLALALLALSLIYAPRQERIASD